MTSQPEKYSVESRAAISLTSFQVVKTQFETDRKSWGDKEASNDCNLSIEFATLKKDNDDSIFGLIFEVCLINETKTFSLEIEAFANFVTTGIKVDEEFVNSKMVTGNATAIIFPYIRTFITNFCQNSGFNPIILPGFNFNQVVPVKS